MSALKRIEKKLLSAASQKSECPSISAKDRALVQTASRAYLKSLSQLRGLAPAKRQYKAIKIRKSVYGRFCALLMVDNGCKPGMSVTELMSRAKRMNVARIRPYKVLVHSITTGNKARMVTVLPAVIQAENLLLKHTLECMDFAGKRDFAAAGAGGEVALMKAIKSAYTGGATHWAAPDVKQCYPTFRRTHFEETSTSWELVRDRAFLPIGCDIQVRISFGNGKPIGAVKEWAEKFPDILKVYQDEGAGTLHSYIKTIKEVVRRGLPQGSCLSPLLAGHFLSKVLGDVAAKTGALAVSFADNLVIGAKSADGAKAAMSELSIALNHPAGQFFLHTPEVAPLHKVEIIGYALRPGQGYGKNPVHVKPGNGRIARHRGKLLGVFQMAEKLGHDPIKSGIKYADQWRGANRAWDKVPKHSKAVCRSCIYSYLSDFDMGIPLGTWKFGKPLLDK